MTFVKWAQSGLAAAALRYGLSILAAVVLVALAWALVPDDPSQVYALDLCVMVLAASFAGRAAAFTVIAAISLLLSYFLLEGEGFAVSKPTDALGLVVFIFSGIAAANCSDALRRRVGSLSSRLQSSDEERAFSASAVAELSHRIGNDLNTLISVATLTGRAAEHPETRLALDSLSQRIRTVGCIYGRLRFAKNAAVRVQMEPFIEDLCEDMRKAYLSLRPISLNVRVARFDMLLDEAVLVGLIINELLTNALKYAFPDERPGSVSVDLALGADGGADWVLTVGDDGVGFDGSAPKGTGFGQKLINAMASQLNARYALSRVDGRTRATVSRIAA